MSKIVAVDQAAALPSNHKITLSDEQLKSGVRMAEKDDTFWDIAVALGVPLADVIKANPHINPKAIQYEGKNRSQINLPKTGAAASEKVKTEPQNTWNDVSTPAPVSAFQQPAPEQSAATSASSKAGRNPGVIQADINAAKAEIQKLEAQLESTPISAYDEKSRDTRNGLYDQIDALKTQVKQLQEELRTGAGASPATAAPATTVNLAGAPPAPVVPSATPVDVAAEKAALKDQLKELRAKLETPISNKERNEVWEQISITEKRLLDLSGRKNRAQAAPSPAPNTNGQIDALKQEQVTLKTELAQLKAKRESSTSDSERNQLGDEIETKTKRLIADIPKQLRELQDLAKKQTAASYNSPA